jgi:hypothetical protein
MAKYCGSPPCAAAPAAPNNVAPIAATAPSANLNRRHEECIDHSLVLDSAKGRIQPPTLT